MPGFSRPRTFLGIEVHVDGEVDESMLVMAFATSSPYLLGSDGSPYLQTARRLCFVSTRLSNHMEEN